MLVVDVGAPYFYVSHSCLAGGGSRLPPRAKALKNELASGPGDLAAAEAVELRSYLP